MVCFFNVFQGAKERKLNKLPRFLSCVQQRYILFCRITVSAYVFLDICHISTAVGETATQLTTAGKGVPHPQVKVNAFVASNVALTSVAAIIDEQTGGRTASCWRSVCASKCPRRLRNTHSQRSLRISRVELYCIPCCCIVIDSTLYCRRALQVQVFRFCFSIDERATRSWRIEHLPVRGLLSFEARV